MVNRRRKVSVGARRELRQSVGGGLRWRQRQAGDKAEKRLTPRLFVR